MPRVKTVTKVNKTKEKVEDCKVLIALSIKKGVITLLDENGDIKYYLQRGIEGMSFMKKAELARMNLLDFNASVEYKDLPQGYKLEFKDASMGRACTTYSAERESKVV